ncbi:hypothetical protein Q4553_13495, partial [Tenacibaculum soleae]|uniref:hypothetical protein n=1 Tax=Tenacibaculum soleae TaxID=447689 RepID=UPI0026E381B2
TATAPAVQTGAPFTDIDTSGDYWVVATDAEGCTSAPLLVNVPVKENITFTAIPQCFDGSDGKIDVNVTNGNGGYEYSTDGTNWTTPTPANATSFTISALSANVAYTVSIRDISGCIETENVTINSVLTASATPTDASCTPLPPATPTGQIAVTPTGGSGVGYVYAAISNGSPAPVAGDFTATNPITGLDADTYDVYVRDDAGCEYIIEDVVIDLITPIAITATVNEPTCNGDTGSIDGVVTANTGQAPYTITLANSGGVIGAETLTNYTTNTFSFNNLPAETYTVEITDALGCISTVTPLTLVNPPAIVMDIEPVLPPNCAIVDPINTGFDFNFGSLTIADYAPYSLEYSLDNGTNWNPITAAMHSISVPPATPGDNLYSVRNLVQGQTYYPSIRIVDGGTTRCQVDNGIFVMPFQVEGIVVDITPGGDCIAGYSVTVKAIGGTGPYEFGISTEDPVNTGTWHPADDLILTPDEKVFNDIIPGLNYLFYVKDVNGCVQTNDPDIPIIFPDSSFDVNITPTATSQSCNGANNGSLSFLIDDEDNVLALPAPGKDFIWELYDGVTDSPVGGISGTITAPVVYPFTLDSSVAGAAALGSLASGRYFLVIEVDNGTPSSCKWASGDIEIQETQPITGNLTVVSDITCTRNGVIRVDNVTGGTAPYTYTVATATNFSTASANVIGNTIEFAYADVITNTSNVTGITVTIADSNGNSCTETIGAVNLIVSQPPVVIYTDPNSCDANKTITTRVNSGKEPYQFSVDGGTFSGDIALDGALGYAEFIAQNLTPGNHVITVRDANGCTVTTNADIQPSLEYTVDLTKNLTCDPAPGDEATYEIDNIIGSGTYTYEVIRNDSGANTVVVAAGTPLPATPFTFSTAIADAYTITITDTAENCISTKTFTVAAAVEPAFTTSVTHATCNGDANGSI